jgi:hypothetical protein
MVNHARLQGSSGPAALPFRAQSETAPNLRTSGGCRAAVDAGPRAASGKISGKEIGGLARFRLAYAALVEI